MGKKAFIICPGLWLLKKLRKKKDEEEKEK